MLGFGESEDVVRIYRKGHQGELTVNGETMQVAVGFTYGSKLNVWPAGEQPSNDNTLFYGDYSFWWNKLNIQVTSDKADLFGGELPTFQFVYQKTRGRLN